MLNPNNDRLEYGQVLAPPEKFKLDFAIGTTYSLDLDALVGACIALGLSEETDSDLFKNPIFLLEVLRATGDKVALFCESGQIKVPNNVTSLYILLEKMVFQICTPKQKGIKRYPSFHPKFWLIRYIDEQNNVLYRIVVLSRNLTFDRSWDVTFTMEGKTSKKLTQKNLPINDFLFYLSKHVQNNAYSQNKQKKILSIINELPYVNFELNSKEFEDYEFLPIGIDNRNGGIRSINDKSFDPLFKDSYHEILIMSPFLSNSVIKDFNTRNTYIAHSDYLLITRAMSLENLIASDCDKFRIFTLKDTIVDGESVISENTQQIQKQDIHAKIFMVRKNSDSYLYLGSMNASNNALRGNIEFVILLKSKNRYLNLTNLKESLFNGPENNVANPFQEVLFSQAITTEDNKDNNQILDDCIKEITRHDPTAYVEANSNYYNLIINFKNLKEYNLSITISPLLSNKTEILSENILFENLLLTQLSNFYKVTVSNDESKIQRIIIIPTKGIPINREKAVISSVIKDKQCFYRYISFLLGDNYVLSALETANSTTDVSTKSRSSIIKQAALYEKMLQTAANAPERFNEIDFLIQALSSDEVIPDNFEELYRAFKKAVK